MILPIRLDLSIVMESGIEKLLASNCYVLVVSKSEAVESLQVRFFVLGLICVPYPFLSIHFDYPTVPLPLYFHSLVCSLIDISFFICL